MTPCTPEHDLHHGSVEDTRSSGHTAVKLYCDARCVNESSHAVDSPVVWEELHGPVGFVLNIKYEPELQTMSTGGGKDNDSS